MSSGYPLIDLKANYKLLFTFFKSVYISLKQTFVASGLIVFSLVSSSIHFEATPHLQYHQRQCGDSHLTSPSPHWILYNYNCIITKIYHSSFIGF